MLLSECSWTLEGLAELFAAVWSPASGAAAVLFQYWSCHVAVNLAALVVAFPGLPFLNPAFSMSSLLLTS